MTWTPQAQAAQAAIDSGWRGYLPQPTTQRVESVAGLTDRQIVARLFTLAGRGAEMLPPIVSPSEGETVSSAPAVYTTRGVWVVWQGSIWALPIEAQRRDDR